MMELLSQQTKDIKNTLEEDRRTTTAALQELRERQDRLEQRAPRGPEGGTEEERRRLATERDRLEADRKRERKERIREENERRTERLREREEDKQALQELLSKRDARALRPSVVADDWTSDSEVVLCVYALPLSFFLRQQAPTLHATYSCHILQRRGWLQVCGCCRPRTTMKWLRGAASPPVSPWPHLSIGQFS